MKRRRGRRGFWWWSWLLLMTAVGGTIGGAFFGKQQWEEADKDYPSVAVLKVGIRAPFKASGTEAAPTGVANVNESQVMKLVESHDNLAGVISNLNLSQKWGLGTEESVSILRGNLDLDLDQKKDELYVQVVRPDPVEAAELANAIAKTVPEVIKSWDEKYKESGLERIKVEARPYDEAVEKSRLELKAALENMNVNLDPKPGVDLEIYMSVPEVLGAKVAWDSARESRAEFSMGQKEFERYWTKPVKPSLLITPATPAPTFTGPELQPFQVQFGLYGLTAGLFLGLLLMAICWKLFP